LVFMGSPAPMPLGPFSATVPMVNNPIQFCNLNPERRIDERADIVGWKNGFTGFTADWG